MQSRRGGGGGGGGGGLVSSSTPRVSTRPSALTSDGGGATDRRLPQLKPLQEKIQPSAPGM